MKCAYKYCKLGGEVKKEDAIKDGRYYHKECHHKQMVKRECKQLLQDEYSFSVRTIYTAIKQLVDDKDWEVDRVKFTIKDIIKNNREINSPYGITYYMENFKIDEAYKKHKKIKQYKESKKEQADNKVNIVDDVDFTYKKKGGKSWEIL